MFDFRKLLEDISSYAILIPLIAGLIVFKNAQVLTKYFLFYLVWGFAVDVPRIYIQNKEINEWVYNFYGLSEVIFILWFIKKATSDSLLIKLSNFGISIMILFWIVCHFVFKPQNPGNDYSALFDSLSAIIISCFAAWELLLLSQRQENLLEFADFWFMAGIFFYFFCTNFIFGFLQTDFLKQIWFLHNIINILTYLIFTKAFLVARKDKVG